MQRLYPDLRGANPLVRSRRIDEHDMQRFQQFGLGYFVNVQENAQTAMNFAPQIKTLLDVFIQRIATRTAVFNDRKQNNLMDWPYLRGDLRSAEKVESNQPPQDLRMKIPRFWITMKQLIMREMLSVSMTDPSHLSTANASGHSDGDDEYRKTKNAYSGSHQTTLDPGGDCHRQPIVKISSDDLNTILASDVCFITSANDTFRHLNCTSKGARNQTMLVLATTSQHSIVD